MARPSGKNDYQDLGVFLGLGAYVAWPVGKVGSRHAYLIFPGSPHAAMALHQSMRDTTSIDEHRDLMKKQL